MKITMNMFNFFNKKSSNQDSIGYCTKLAAEARIFVTLDNGNYIAFVIYLDIDKLPLIEHLKSQEAYTAFVKVIEERIRNDQYDDPGMQGMVKEMRENAGWKKNLNVVRIVAGLENKPLFSWNPPH
jgi:hypothetical protein